MRILAAHCDFARISLALTNCKGYALQDQAIRDAVTFRTVSGYPDDDPETWIARVLEAADEFRPEIIALSVYVWSRYRMYAVTRLLRRRHPEARIVWGGPDVSDQAYADELLKVHHGVDVIVRDEGERTFKRLLHHWLGDGSALADVPGITYRDEDGIRTTGQVDFLDNLDDIPSILDAPELEAIIDDIPDIALETFRGCYMGCAYCYWGGTQRRAYSNERIFSDLERVFARPNIKKIWFFDSMFGYKKSLAKEMLRFIVERKAPDQSITMFPNLDFLDEELCVLLKEAGVYIEAGIQTVNEEAYEYLNRKWDRRFLDSKMPLLEKYGLRANAQQLILGLPGDSIDGFRRSVDYAFDMRPEAIQVFPFSVLPATGYWRRKEEFNVRYEGEYRIVYDSTTFPEDDMVVGGLIMAGCKWFDLHPGFAAQLVGLLGCPAAEWFENLGRTFMEVHWGLVDGPDTRAEVRTRLLCQAFVADDADRIRGTEIIHETFQRHYADRDLQAALDELLRHHDLLNAQEVLDARVLPETRVAEALVAWQAHPESIPVTHAAFNVFETATSRQSGRMAEAIEYAAYPVEGPVDYFGKTLPRYRVIVLGDPGSRSLPLQRDAGVADGR
ncbi:MAG: cobalamin B12-binding domain-containing protein [Planctomycetes bacterium]|nr:cobalamin B12-binding domain-containing protein [Planctomycetota bacterium]